LAGIKCRGSGLDITLVIINNAGNYLLPCGEGSDSLLPWGRRAGDEGEML
jgi:hypothetical protein